MTKNDEIMKAVKKNENMLLKTFLQKFLKEFDSTCYYFYKLYNDIGLENFYKLFFGFNI